MLLLIEIQTMVFTLEFLAKCLRLSGGDHMHSGTVVGKLEGDRDSTLGWIDCMRDSFIKEDRSRGIFFDQDFGSMPGMLPWHPVVSMFGICLHLVNIFGDNSVLQFGGGTLGHPWGNAAGAAANRVAVEACVEARNAGRELEKESKIFSRVLRNIHQNSRLRWRPGKRLNLSLIRLTN